MMSQKNKIPALLSILFALCLTALSSYTTIMSIATHKKLKLNAKKISELYYFRDWFFRFRSLHFRPSKSPQIKALKRKQLLKQFIKTRQKKLNLDPQTVKKIMFFYDKAKRTKKSGELKQSKDLNFSPANPAKRPIISYKRVPSEIEDASYQAIMFMEKQTQFTRSKIMVQSVKLSTNGRLAFLFAILSCMLTLYLVSAFFSSLKQRARWKQLSKKLQKSEAKNSAILKALPDLLLILSSNALVTDIQIEPKKNWFAQEPLKQGDHLDTFFKTKDQTFQKLIQSSVVKQISLSLEWERETTSGTQFLEFRFQPLSEDQVLCVIRDVTERIHFDKMRDEFVSMVSHELRTPLTSIRGALGLLSNNVISTEAKQFHSVLEIASRNSDRLSILINDLLDSQKILLGGMTFFYQKLELNQLIQQALEANQEYAKQFNVEFIFESNPQALFVNVDSNRLFQVLNNLLSNAAKFSNPNQPIHVRLKKKQQNVRVEIQDYGIGIPESFRSQIFEKFSQLNSGTTRQSQGTGLGLNISKVLLRQMGGNLDFQSKLDQGSLFFFELPLVTEPKSDA